MPTTPCRRLVAKLRAKVKRLKSQLPTGMKHCTIIFKQCPEGHGELTAGNWVQHPCQQCEINKLRKELECSRKRDRK